MILLYSYDMNNRSPTNELMNLYACNFLGRSEYLQLIVCSLWYDQTRLRLEIKMFLSADVNFSFKNVLGVVQRL